RAQILAFIEQSGLNGGRRAILEAHRVEYFANGFAFFRAQGASGSGARRRGPCRTEHRLAIEGSAGHAERLTGGLDADRGREPMNGVHHSLSISSSVGSGQPNSVPSFFWTSMMRAALRSSSVRRTFSFWSFCTSS